MSEKQADEAKEEEAKGKKKPDEAKEKPAKAKSKSTKAKEEPADAGAAETKPEAAEDKEKPAEAKEKPAEAKAEADDAKAEAVESKEKQAEAQEKPAEATAESAKDKPLEKMTVKELREMAKEIPGITGVHGMKKEELIVAIKDAKGIKVAPAKKTDATIAALKHKIKALKVERQAALQAKDKKMATIYRRRISKLKKKTRRAAA